MRRVATVVTIVIALIASPGRAKDGDDPREIAKKDLAKLQGGWSLVTMEVEGKLLESELIDGWASSYEGDKLTLKAKDEIRRRGIVTIDPSRTPKAMNTWDLDGPFQDQTVPGIYTLDGDDLKLCFARPGQQRPTEFTTKTGSGFLLVVYQRQKP